MSLNTPFTIVNSRVENDDHDIDADQPLSDSQTTQPLNPGPIQESQVSANAAVLTDQPFADETLSQTPTTNFYPLDLGYVPAERLAGLIFFAFLLVGAIVGLAVKFFSDGLDTAWVVLAVVAALILLLTLWSAIFWPPIKFRNIRWRLDSVGLEIQRGVIWKHRTSIPLARVQHADVSQGPIQRSYDIGTLTVHTAGTVGASVDLEGLSHAVALDLRDRLVRQRNINEGAPA